MAKRKITVTVDEGLVEAVQALGSQPLSSVVNQALETEVDRLAQAAALARLLAQWDDELGPVSEEAAAVAAAAFDDVDAVGSTTVTDPSRDRRRGTSPWPSRSVPSCRQPVPGPSTSSMPTSSPSAWPTVAAWSSPVIPMTS